jgi:hypothetical protein
VKLPSSRLLPPTLLGVLGLAAGAWLGIELGPKLQGSEAGSAESAVADASRAVEAPPSPAVGSSAAGSTADAELWAILEEEREARQRLEDEVAALRAEVDALARGGTEANPGERAATLAPEGGSGRPWFDEKGLLNAGVDPVEAQELRERFEEIELARLYLRDRAAREGWSGSSRYREESRALDARFERFREDLGPAAYDRLLFAIGRPNRARVQDLLERAPAREAGMKAGDVILSYDDRRIFTIAELRQATTEGQSGARVEVRVERDGETIRLYVPRGPLGARLVPTRRPPLE